ncbi:SAM-dependent methyltransferase [Actinoalloteichus caeruleus]|uniref:S-adenosyl methyltransferase n=1 Tax=Actinoalloteichus caeruleus DSM 43889 TaxID=1120930 RepID=A0ABT1JFZ3_ACTCY|nr:SAM-dependent methyltransferase [Actinoalloteichus caeruleus]MCP2331204.1 S-adenosyl methyltransferase [Actinoalloteichus caeruleus DSM 43889]
MPRSDESAVRQFVTPPMNGVRASMARVYDSLLGGKDNYEADREVTRDVLGVFPEARQVAREHRRWLSRAVRYLAGRRGIDQFLDLGCGLPTEENVHEIAQRANPEARVVYVDVDPIVIAQGPALLEENDRTHFVAGDLGEPDILLAHPTLTRYLDWERPVALLQCLSLVYLGADRRPHEVVRRYVEALPAGSCVAMSHLLDPGDGGPVSALAREVAAVYEASSMTSVHFRAEAEIESYFDGLELVRPGLTRPSAWWPDGPRLNPPPESDRVVVVGVGVKR